MKSFNQFLTESFPKHLLNSWMEKYDAATFEWTDGPLKGAKFYSSHCENRTSSDPHLRGNYEDHPEFGDIKSDIHQVSSLLEDIINGHVKVTSRGQDVTSKAIEDSEMMFEDEDEDYYPDDEDELEEKVLGERKFDKNVGEKGIDRDKLKDSDFADPENKAFPIVVPKDVGDAVKALGRAKGDKEAIKKNIIKIAKAKGMPFVARLPKDWK